eukprot:gene6516-30278_t
MPRPASAGGGRAAAGLKGENIGRQPQGMCRAAHPWLLPEAAVRTRGSSLRRCRAAHPWLLPEAVRTRGSSLRRCCRRHPWLLPEAAVLPTTKTETVPAPRRAAVAAAVAAAFDAPGISSRGYADIFGFAVAMLSTGPPLSDGWARATLARLSVERAAAGRANQLDLSHFAAAVCCLTRLHTPHDFGTLMDGLEESGRVEGVWASVADAGDDPAFARCDDVGDGCVD